jgi:NAD(P)-dependent dehydrogenase (short-subunit alcohol dehydrogenase family)
MEMVCIRISALKWRREWADAPIMDRTLAPMRVLITGAAGAIGAATAIELTDAGHEVVATARDASLLDGLDVAQSLEMDVTDEKSIRTAIDAAGELDAIVNNAGICGKGQLESFPVEQLRCLLETNAIGPVALVQEVLPSWRGRASGVIVNVSSVHGRVAAPLQGHYCASKFALEALSESLRFEVGHFGIRVVIIEPGFTAPGMKTINGFVGDRDYDQLWRQWEGVDEKVAGPDGRPGPELVAQAIRGAIEDPTTPLRVPVGPHAALILKAREQLDDAEFESAMREMLCITW